MEDRHQQNPSTGSGTGVNYTLDLAAGLTQVLSDGTNTYLYGNGRISQHDTGTPDTSYFLGDALGSVRQLADSAGAVTLTQSYAPYGETISSMGTGSSIYQYTGEIRDANGLTYLRARYYNSGDGRFISRDTWNGDYNRPLSLNRWGYVEGNPVNYMDPSGMIPEGKGDEADEFVEKLRRYNIHIEKDWGYQPVPIYLSGVWPGELQIGCEWQEGNWRTVRELRLVIQAVHRISNRIGDAKFRSAMGHVKIVRWTSRYIGGPFDYRVRSFTLPGRILVGNDMFRADDNRTRYDMIHEFGHIWDWHEGLRLSSEMSTFIGTRVCQHAGAGGRSTCWFDIDAGREDAPGDWRDRDGKLGLYGGEDSLYAARNALEDWAEAFANYIYPSY